MPNKARPKTKNIDGYELSFDSDWTKSLESRKHWGFYWNQAWLVHQYTSLDERLIEIGVGTGFLSNYLRGLGWDVLTVDIDEDKNPDIVCDVSTYDFSNDSFSSVIAFEIFEHIPFPLFRRTVKNICSEKPNIVIFSLPWSVRKIAHISIKVPKIKKIEFNILMPKSKIYTKNHFWELKRKGRGRREVIEDGEKGLISVKDVSEVFLEQGYRVAPLHREGRIQFFVAFIE